MAAGLGLGLGLCMCKRMGIRMCMLHVHVHMHGMVCARQGRGERGGGGQNRERIQLTQRKYLKNGNVKPLKQTETCAILLRGQASASGQRGAPEVWLWEDTCTKSCSSLVHTLRILT